MSVMRQVHLPHSSSSRDACLGVINENYCTMTEIHCLLPIAINALPLYRAITPSGFSQKLMFGVIARTIAVMPKTNRKKEGSGVGVSRGRVFNAIQNGSV